MRHKGVNGDAESFQNIALLMRQAVGLQRKRRREPRALPGADMNDPVGVNERFHGSEEILMIASEGELLRVVGNGKGLNPRGWISLV